MQSFVIRTRASTFLAAFLGFLWATSASGQTGSSCQPEAGVSFICGVNNAEDLVRIPGTSWIIASSTAGPTEKGNHLYFIKMPLGSVTAVDPDQTITRKDPRFGSCPAKFARGTFSGHGLFISATERRLYAVNHGREAIEIFDIVGGSDVTMPSLSWVGCVLSPPNVQLNAVIALPDGGIAATKFYDGRDAPNRWASDLIDGEPTGYVIEWHPGIGWRNVADSAVSGPNGLALSPDGQNYYIAAWGNRRLVRLSRGTEPTHRESIDVGIYIDNLRWDEDGNLITAGQILSGREASTLKCLATAAVACPIPYRVIKIDPNTLEAEVVVHENNDKFFTAGSVAIDMGREWLVGTFRGDRIARIVKK
jgi:hypothetical protein